MRLLQRNPAQRATAQQARTLQMLCEMNICCCKRCQALSWHANPMLGLWRLFMHLPALTVRHSAADLTELTSVMPWRQALSHPWLVEQGVAPRHPLDNVVLRRLQRFAAMNKLKRAALLVMAQNLSPAELAGLKHLFSAIDSDNSGSITAAELRAALEGLGEKIPEDDLQAGTAAAAAHGCPLPPAA